MVYQIWRKSIDEKDVFGWLKICIMKQYKEEKKNVKKIGQFSETNISQISYWMDIIQIWCEDIKFKI